MAMSLIRTEVLKFGPLIQLLNLTGEHWNLTGNESAGQIQIPNIDRPRIPSDPRPVRHDDRCETSEQLQEL